MSCLSTALSHELKSQYAGLMAKYFSRQEIPYTHLPTNWPPAFSNLSVHHSWHCPIHTMSDRCNWQRRCSSSCGMSHCTFPYGMSTKMLRWNTKRCKKIICRIGYNLKEYLVEVAILAGTLKRGRLPARMFGLPIRWWAMARKGHIYIYLLYYHRHAIND